MIEDLKHLWIDSIAVHSKKGSGVSDYIREGIMLAITECQSVILTHNEKKYGISPGQLIDIILESEEGT